ncbi:MAG TPA: 50S ribosomal protein L25 [Candidatus Limnocylindria bacterium]
MDLQIAVDARDVTGKHTKRLRNAGIVPGVLFGKKAGSVPVQLDAKAFDALYREAGRTTVVGVSVAGGRPTSAVIKNVQRHPLTGRVLHVDFFAPDMTHEMVVEIPVVYTGEAPGVEMTGGYLLTSLDTLRVRALPSDLPHEFVVDVSPLVDLEAAIHVRDLPVPERVTVLTDPDEIVARVMPPRVEVEEEPVEAAEEEAAEGEAEAGEGAETPAGGEESAEEG